MYTAIATTKSAGKPIYVVADGTGKWLHVYDCMLWAEKKARELNEAWDPCYTCVFSDMSAAHHVCAECDDRRYK